MDRIGADQDHTVGRNRIPLQFVSSDGFAAEDRGGRIETQRFLNDHACVLQLRKVRNAWHPVTKDLVQLSMQTALDLGRLREQVPGPRQGIGRGFVTGKQKRHDFVARLPVIHPLACLLILRQQEHREQITPLGLTCSALSNHAIDQLIQHVDRPLDPAVAWGRDRQRREGPKDVIAELFQ